MHSHSLQAADAHQIMGHTTAGGRVEWGHLAAGDSNLKAAFERRQGQQYDLVEEEPHTGTVPVSGADDHEVMAPLGRGQDATKPAWMTHPDSAAAPGSTGTGSYRW